MELGITIGFVSIVLIFAIIVAKFTKTYEKKRKWFMLIATIYFIIAAVMIIGIISVHKLTELIDSDLNKYPVLQQLISHTDVYVLSILHALRVALRVALHGFNEWIDKNNLENWMSAGFCMVALSQYSLCKHKENKEYKPMIKLYAVSISLSWAYLIMTIFVALIYIDEKSLNFVSHLVFVLTFLISFLEWTLIDKEVERSKKPTKKEFLVDVCSNADIQCIHKSYTIRWHELDS